MNNTLHTFTCAMITLTCGIMNFVLDNPAAGWILLGLTIIILALGWIEYKKEKRR